MKTKKRIYMDYAATAYVDPRVEKAMRPFWSEKFGNPSSLHHEGRIARMAVDEARAKIAETIGAKPSEIIFTSGGTESDNLAILGIVGATYPIFSRLYPKLRLGPYADSKIGQVASTSEGCLFSESASEPFGLRREENKQPEHRPHLITSKIEHPAVLNPCKFLEKNGFDVTYLDVGKEGIMNPEDVKKALRPETILVSIMYANNEIGTIQPIAEIAKVIRNFRSTKHEARSTKKSFGFRNSDFEFHEKIPFFHVDACQAGGYLDLNVEKLGVDLMTVNGSKIYGPKGVGFLYVKRGVKLSPIMHGGEHEWGLRPGTENVAGIVGLAEALKIAQKEKDKETKRLTVLRDYFIKRLTTKIPKVFLNGHPMERLPNNVNVSVLGAEGEAIVLYLDEAGIACSTGSACSSASLEPSHVIMALGRPYEYGHGSLRFSLGKTTTKKDIDYVMKVLPEIVKKLRSISVIK